MKVAIGSENRPKVDAVDAAFTQTFVEEEGFLFIAETVDSGVADHPTTLDEGFRGATNRIQAMMEILPGADYYVGIEGSLYKAGGVWFETGCVVVCDRHGRTGRSTSVGMGLPPNFAFTILEGSNLNDVVKEAIGEEFIGKSQGYFGFLTDGRVDRTKAYTDAVMAALGPLRHQKIFP